MLKTEPEKYIKEIDKLIVEEYTGGAFQPISIPLIRRNLPELLSKKLDRIISQYREQLIPANKNKRKKYER